MNRHDPARRPHPGMVWSQKWKMWLDVDDRSPAERRADEAIAQGAEREAEALMRNLVAARKSAGLTQVQVARLMKVAQPVVARLEAGTHSPTLETLIRYASAVGVKFDVLSLRPITSRSRTRKTPRLSPFNGKL